VVDGDNGKIDGGIKTDRISLRTRTGDTEISVLHDETVMVQNTSGSVEITAAGDVKINGGSVSVAREGDATLIDPTTDAAFFTWVNAVSAGLPVPIVAPAIPTSVTGKINDGSSTVKVP
jgi:hypothetical protein